MGDYHTFYGGTNYGMDPDYGKPIKPGLFSGQVSIATDVRTANQLKATSEKINAGAKAIEVSAIFPNIAEAIPNQHLEELNRLGKITGVDLTLHGPLIEPTGISDKGGGWSEAHREQAERQIWNAVDRAHMVKPDGNIVVTLHTSNGLPEPRTRIIDKDGNQVDSALGIINERTGSFRVIQPKEDYFHGKKSNVNDELDRQNKEFWTQNLAETNRAINIGNQSLKESLRIGEEKNMPDKINEGIPKIYKMAKENPEKYKELLSDYKDIAPIIQNRVDHIYYGESLVRNAYSSLQELYNQAYESALREKDEAKKNDTLRKLDNFKKDTSKAIEKYSDDPAEVIRFAQEVDRGVKILDSISPPKLFRPLEEFAIDKASDTFSGVAFNSFKKFKDTSPIISIENPPAGSGLSRAEDMKVLIDETRKKFVNRTMEELHLSKSEAEKQAEKLIGATWDVGHINMIRKYGYGDKELIEQTKTIAPYVKNIHLSDNFGLEHTELPMGMGNVPMQGHLKVLQGQFKDKLKEIKTVIETGDWYQHFQTTPFDVTLAAFGSPLYSAKMAPYWNQAYGQMGGYAVSQYGMNPEIHHSLYGAGFSTLPVELGGQMSGRSRASGAPIE